MYHHIYPIKKILKDVDDINEIIQFIKDNPKSKMPVFKYVALKSSNKAHLVKPLLMSGLYSPADIYWETFNAEFYDKTTLQYIDKFSSIYWQNQTEFSSDLLHRTIHSVEGIEENIVKRMKYFYTINKDIFEGFKAEYIKRFSIRQMYLVLRKIGVSNEDLYDFEKEHYQALNVSDTKHLLSYKPGLSGETNIALVMYKVNERNKWSAFEKIAAENPKLFEKLTENYVKVKTVKSEVVKYSRDEILKRYGDKTKEQIPEPIFKYVENLKLKFAKNEEVKEEKEKYKENLKKSWYDEQGGFAISFRIGPFVTSCVEDCEMILKKYLEDGLAIDKFCKKYEISNSKEFMKMLDKFSLMSPDLKNKIEGAKQRVSAKHYASIMSIVDDFCDGKISTEQFIETTLNRKSSWQNLKAFLEKNNEVERLEKMTSKLINYYHGRINSFDIYSNKVEEIVKALTNKELKFILGNDKFTQLITGKKLSMGKEFLSLVNVRFKQNPKILSEKVYGKAPNKVMYALDQCGIRYKKENNATLTIMLDNGEWLQVPEETIDDAEKFVKLKKLYKGTLLMGNVIRAIANGKLNVSDYTKSNSTIEDDEFTTNENIQYSNYGGYFSNLNHYLDFVDSNSIM